MTCHKLRHINIFSFCSYSLHRMNIFSNIFGLEEWLVPRHVDILLMVSFEDFCKFYRRHQPPTIPHLRPNHHHPHQWPRLVQLGLKIIFTIK